MKRLALAAALIALAGCVTDGSRRENPAGPPVPPDIRASAQRAATPYRYAISNPVPAVTSVTLSTTGTNLVDVLSTTGLAVKSNAWMRLPNVRLPMTLDVTGGVMFFKLWGTNHVLVSWTAVTNPWIIGTRLWQGETTNYHRTYYAGLDTSILIAAFPGPNHFAISSVGYGGMESPLSNDVVWTNPGLKLFIKPAKP